MADYPRDAVSHSQISSYIRCGKQFELERISGYPAPPAWYFIGGNAVHKATEFLDKHYLNPADIVEDDISEAWEEIYSGEVTEEFLRWPDDSEWLKFGRRNAEQGYAFWYARGLAGVRAYVAWRQAHPELVVESIEEAFTVELEGVKVTGRIDRVYRSPEGRIVVDLKSGSRRPESALQLGIYRLGYDVSHGAPEGTSLVRSAGYLMTKDGELYLQDISPFTPELIRRMLVTYLEGVHKDVFLPNIGDACFHCSMKKACASVSGPTAEALAFDSLLRS